jgi:hypothetical protein
MTFIAKSYVEACELAREMRATYFDTDWVVSIVAPLFPGDFYRVNVGTED